MIDRCLVYGMVGALAAIAILTVALGWSLQ